MGRRKFMGAHFLAVGWVRRLDLLVQRPVNFRFLKRPFSNNGCFMAAILIIIGAAAGNNRKQG